MRRTSTGGGRVPPFSPFPICQGTDQGSFSNLPRHALCLQQQGPQGGVPREAANASVANAPRRSPDTRVAPSTCSSYDTTTAAAAAIRCCVSCVERRQAAGR